MGDDTRAVYSRFSDASDGDSTLDLKVRDNYQFSRCGAVRQWCDSNRKTISFIVLAAALFFIGIVLGHFLHFVTIPHCDIKRYNGTRNATMPLPTQEPAPVSNYSNMVHTIISETALDAYLRRYTTGPHYAGSPKSAQIITDIKNAWTAQSFEVYTKTYNVQLSRPNRTHPTRFDTYGKPSVCCNSTYYPDDNYDDDMLPGFNPYSPNTEIEAKLVYISYGGLGDFITLRDAAHISVEGNICLVRLGKWSIPSIVENCREHGGVAVVLFPDALHYAPNVIDHVNPNTWWLPVNATIRDPVRLAFGDPLTPILPSLEYGTFNATESDGVTGDVNFPTDFPVQVIGYEQARKYLTTMSHPVAPDDWQGVMLNNHTFSVGPGFASQARKFKMKVNNVKSMETITNIFGMIKGAIESDRYVIIGNHRDSLTYGGVQPGTGTACLMELSRVLGILYSKGWRPRRTVILASWDAGDDGNIGSAEWVEENVEVLRERAVAYINLDGAVEGNYTFSAAGSPLLSQIMYYATQRVQCPDTDHESMTVYKNWAQKKPSAAGAEIEPLGLGNDAAPFLHVAGVPVVDVKYTYDKKFYKDMPTYPTRHTAFDTYEYVRKFIDPNMKIHAAVTEIVAEAVLALADDPLLKIQVVNYADALMEYFRDIRKTDDTNFGNNITLDYLNEVIQRFSAAAQEFQQQYYIPPDMDDENLLRDLNDRVTSIDRALTGDAGTFYLPQLRHVVYGPSRNGYDGDGFAPLKRAMWLYGEQGNDWESVSPTLSTTIARIEAAAHLLTTNPLESDYSLTRRTRNK